MTSSDPAGDAALLQGIAALRRAGDAAGAMALVDRWLAEAGRDGGPSLAVEAELFRLAALDPTLSPALFRHLVDHFGWWDPAGRAAQAEPDAHAVLLDRLAAEDWFAGLHAAAARPGDPAAIVLGRRPAGVLDAAGQHAAREIIARLLHWDHILLDRLDGEHLAALREAVEGPPAAVNLPPPGKPFPSSRVAAFRHSIGWSGQAVIVLFLGAVAWTVWDAVPWRPAPTEQEVARSALAGTTDRWVEFRQHPDATTVYLTQLASWRAGLRTVRYGLDTEQPDRTLRLTPSGSDDEGIVQAPAGLHFVSVQLTWFDGSTSPVQVFRVGGNGG